MREIHPGPYPTTLYDPEKVIQLFWSSSTMGGESIKIEKRNGQWLKLSGAPFIRDLDQWETQRRAIVFSKLQLEGGIPVPQELGKIEIKLANTESIVGIYNNQNFFFTDGPAKGKGFRIGSNKELQKIITEGIWGFYPHTLDLCRLETLKELQFNEKNWALKKDKLWYVVRHESKEKGLAEPIELLLRKICNLKIDEFVGHDEIALDGAKTLMTFKVGSLVKELKKNGETFILPGFQPFKSNTLLDTLSLTDPQDLTDPTSKVAKTAVDKKASQEERLKAIRKLHGNKSKESIGALREIIFEQTDIDIYRYEAVDALAEIGTKDAYKVLIERLPQVGRSGFELRIARALAAAMGTFLKSDEHTPEDVRRPEVDALVQMALKNPPGK